MSWLHSGEGYHLLSNRDEKRTRAHATGPEIRLRDGVRYLAPADGEAGGTWIAVNEFGLGLCLLNSTGCAPSGRLRSRGLLIPELIACSGGAEAEACAVELDLTTFAPFTLAILEPGGRVRILEWNGSVGMVVQAPDVFLPLASSSIDAEGVRARRHDQFRRTLKSAGGKLNADLLLAFHHSHGDGPGAYSPCMHRQDAETVSFSRIHIGARLAEFTYIPSAPCLRKRGQICTLPLRSVRL